MPGIAQISEKLADEALGLADEHYKHSKVGSLLERVKGLVTSPNANDNGEPYNNGIIPDICPIDKLAKLVGVGEKNLETILKTGDGKGNEVFKAYKFSENGYKAYVVKEEILKLITHLQAECNYTDYKWKKGDADYD